MWYEDTPDRRTNVLLQLINDGAVELTVRDPQQNRIYIQQDVTYEKYKFTPSMTGEYKVRFFFNCSFDSVLFLQVCLTNTARLQSATVYLKWWKATPGVDEDNDGNSDAPTVMNSVTSFYWFCFNVSFLQLETMALKIHDQLGDIGDYQMRMQLREGRSRRISKSRLASINFWSAIGSVAIVLAGISQVLFLASSKEITLLHCRCSCCDARSKVIASTRSALCRRACDVQCRLETRMKL